MSAALRRVHAHAAYFVLSPGHTKDVFSVTASPDGAAVVSGSLDNTLRIWEAADSRLGFLVVFVCARAN
jgi:hypothetical protein